MTAAGLSEARASEHERSVVAAEWIAMGVIVAVYAASFGLASSVNGMGEEQEIFGQDSRYMIRALAKRIPYEWNAQNHILYHLLTERLFGVWHALSGAEGVDSAFRFLKVFTTLTGVGFLIAFRVLLIELGVPTVKRLALLPVVGFSLAHWFHYAAFETSGLTLPFILIAIWAFVRRVRKHDVSVQNHVLFVGSLLIALWVRSDQFRLPFAIGVTLLLPQVRHVRTSLLRDLAVFAVLAPVGFSLLASIYFGVGPWDGLLRFGHREDYVELVGSMRRLDNFSPRKLWVMARALGVYSLVMPIGDDRWPFSTGARWFFRSPLGAVALLSSLAFLGRTAFASFRCLRAADPLHVVLWVTWVSGWLFFVWFNPVEPFLWVVQFGVLVFIAFADTYRAVRPAFTAAIALFGGIVLLHNMIFFWRIYR